MIYDLNVGPYLYLCCRQVKKFNPRKTSKCRLGTGNNDLLLFLRGVNF